MRVHLADDLASFIKRADDDDCDDHDDKVIMIMVMGTLGDDHVSFI